MKKYEEKLKMLDQMQSKVELREDSISIAVAKVEAMKGRLEEKIREYTKNTERLEEYQKDPENNATMIEEVKRESIDIADKISTELSEFTKSIAPNIDGISKGSSDVENSSKFISDSLERFQNYLSSLSTVEQGAIASILFSISIYYCATSIATLYYGDRIIIYFKLEEKYPRLARWIKYRRTLQHYSIGFNLVLLYFIAGYVAYVNILIFNGL